MSSRRLVPPSHGTHAEAGDSESLAARIPLWGAAFFLLADSFSVPRDRSKDYLDLGVLSSNSSSSSWLGDLVCANILANLGEDALPTIPSLGAQGASGQQRAGNASGLGVPRVPH